MTSVTVVVAVYDVGPYLDACVSSILAQSHEDLEVLLVDDGSRDGSGEVCDRFAARDGRVRVIHRINGGLSAARNSGLREATGEYVVFLDGDDWMDSDAVRWLINAAGDKPDVVVSGFHVDTEDASGAVIKHETRLPAPTAIVNGIPSGRLRADNAFVGLVGYAWNKLYRRQLLVANDLEFEEDLLLVEDVVFNRGVFDVASRVVFLDAAGVHYMQRPRVTLGTAARPDLLHLRLRAMDAIQGILKDCGVEDRALQNAWTSMALVTLKGMVLADKGGGVAHAWSGTRRMMDGYAYRILLLSLPSTDTLSARDKVWVLLLRCGLAPLLSIARQVAGKSDVMRRAPSVPPLELPPRPSKSKIEPA